MDLRLSSFQVGTIGVSLLLRNGFVDHNVPFDLLVLSDKFKDKSWPIADGNPATPDMRFMQMKSLKRRS